MALLAAKLRLRRTFGRRCQRRLQSRSHARVAALPYIVTGTFTATVRRDAQFSEETHVYNLRLHCRSALYLKPVAATARVTD